MNFSYMKSVIFFVFLTVCWTTALAQIKKEAKVVILADDKLDKEGFINQSKKILNDAINPMIIKDYNGKLEKPNVQVNIMNDEHEVGANQLIINFIVNTSKNYNNENFCKTICNILENEFLKVNVKTGNCDCKLSTMKK